MAPNDIDLSTDEEIAPVPNTDGDYWVTTEGRVFSTKGGKWWELSQTRNSRVKLYRYGDLYEPKIKTLQQRAFGSGDDGRIRDDHFLEYLSERYGDLDAPEVQQWLADLPDRL